MNQRYDPLTLRSYFKRNPARLLWNQVRKSIGPFDHRNAIAKKIIFQSKPHG
jgi:hypothetical protein